MSGFRQIRAGDTVKFLVPAGTGRNGVEYKEAGGRVVMAFPSHLVVNMGGRHGTPGVVNEGNFLSGTHKRSKSCTSN